MIKPSLLSTIQPHPTSSGLAAMGATVTAFPLPRKFCASSARQRANQARHSSFMAMVGSEVRSAEITETRPRKSRLGVASLLSVRAKQSMFNPKPIKLINNIRSFLILGWHRPSDCIPILSTSASTSTVYTSVYSTCIYLCVYIFYIHNLMVYGLWCWMVLTLPRCKTGNSFGQLDLTGPRLRLGVFLFLLPARSLGGLKWFNGILQ